MSAKWNSVGANIERLVGRSKRIHSKMKAAVSGIDETAYGGTAVEGVYKPTS